MHTEIHFQVAARVRILDWRLHVRHLELRNDVLHAGFAERRTPTTWLSLIGRAFILLTRAKLCLSAHAAFANTVLSRTNHDYGLLSTHHLLQKVVRDHLTSVLLILTLTAPSVNASKDYWLLDQEEWTVVSVRCVSTLLRAQAS